MVDHCDDHDALLLGMSTKPSPPTEFRIALCNTLALQLPTEPKCDEHMQEQPLMQDQQFVQGQSSSSLSLCGPPNTQPLASAIQGIDPAAAAPDIARADAKCVAASASGAADGNLRAIPSADAGSPADSLRSSVDADCVLRSTPCVDDASAALVAGQCGSMAEADPEAMAVPTLLTHSNSQVPMSLGTEAAGMLPWDHSIDSWQVCTTLAHPHPYNMPRVPPVLKFLNIPPGRVETDELSRHQCRNSSLLLCPHLSLVMFAYVSLDVVVALVRHGINSRQPPAIHTLSKVAFLVQR